MRTCHLCEDCVYIGEGGYICSLNNEVVIENWEPTKFYCHCTKNSKKN